jgi:hypothetical protein
VGEILEFGEALDFWRVVGIDRDKSLSLRAEMKLPGEAQLDFTIEEIEERGRARGKAVYTNQRNELVLQATLKGILPGPVERHVMQAMVAEGDPTNRRPGTG